MAGIFDYLKWRGDIPLAAVPLGEAVKKVSGAYSLVFGNEATGLPDVFAGYGISTLIPHSNQIDSLNLAIAAGIGMYAFQNRDK